MLVTAVLIGVAGEMSCATEMSLLPGGTAMTGAATIGNDIESSGRSVGRDTSGGMAGTTAGVG